MTSPETRMDKLIAQLIEGPGARRHEVLTHIRGGRFDDPASLASRLIAMIYGTYSARTEVSSQLSAGLRNAIAVTRSWMLSADLVQPPRSARGADHRRPRRPAPRTEEFCALLGAGASVPGAGHRGRSRRAH